MFSKIQNHFNKIEKKLMLLIEPVLGASKTSSPTYCATVPWEPSEFLRNVDGIIKTFGAREIGTRTYCLRTFCPNLH